MIMASKSKQISPNLGCTHPETIVGYFDYAGQVNRRKSEFLLQPIYVGRGSSSHDV